MRELRVFVLSFAVLLTLAALALPLAAGGQDDETKDEESSAAPSEPAKSPAPEQAAPAPAEPGPVAVPGPGQTVGSPALAPASSAPRAEGGKAQSSDSASKLERARKSATKSVTIKDFEFSPKSITVAVGDTVTWTNDGPTDHSATAEGEWDTGIMKEGERGSHRFTEAGKFSYICTPHPNMKATVVVSGAGDPASGGTGDTSATGDEATTADDGIGGTGTDSSSSGSSADGKSGSLANTGYDAWLVALIGAVLITGGYTLRRQRT